MNTESYYLLYKDKIVFKSKFLKVINDHYLDQIETAHNNKEADFRIVNEYDIELNKPSKEVRTNDF